MELQVFVDSGMVKNTPLVSWTLDLVTLLYIIILNFTYYSFKNYAVIFHPGLNTEYFYTYNENMYTDISNHHAHNK